VRTKADCKALFLRYLDEATKKGVAIPVTKNADYIDKLNYFLNEAQIYVAQQIKIPAVHNVTQNPILNQLGNYVGFDMVQYLPGEDKVLTGTGTKSFYFEMDNIGTVTVAINGATTQVITNTAKKVFAAHKYNTGATATDTVTITFSGLYPYNIRNTALYAYAFPTNDDIPDYTPYVEYAMPDDFMSFDMVINRTDPKIYEAYVAYKWENNRKVILNYFDKGSFDIHYFAYPVTILPTDADTVAMSVEDKAIDLVVLQAGIMATAADNPSLSSWLRSLYIEKIQNVTTDNRISETGVQTVYSI
jgi:hypothetical protein